MGATRARGRPGTPVCARPHRDLRRCPGRPQQEAQGAAQHEAAGPPAGPFAYASRARCPLSADLLDAVSAFLLREARPATADKVVAFKLLVVSHLLGGLARELRDGGAVDQAEEARLAALLGLPAPAPGEAGAADRQRLHAHQLAEIADPDTGPARLNALLDAQLETLSDGLIVHNPFFDRSVEPQPGGGFLA
jgi:hypothetical protein